jgi:chromate transport protein ChrA
MKKLVIILSLSLILLIGCATNNTRQGAMLGAGAGTIAAVLADKSPATSALFILGGALLGGAIGNEMDEQERARQVSIQNPTKKIVMVEEEDTQRTDCKKVTTREWKNGKLLSETTQEVCTGKKTTSTY